MAVSVYIDITAGGKLQSHGNSTAKKMRTLYLSAEPVNLFSLRQNWETPKIMK